ncbi:hypothetical protein KY290_033840 [Solanum tuberosum]|uniref:Integrase core domain containing protein n=1 Tax=Solanum tuberosum TaxID=4113 RepID=A0ABQ7U1I5_SOLTU|nr:hypothetical protein KY289_033216 [Solanum tuberosum]KAH0647854.1 hypothetical protein KY285_033102 [Solanum tuberosum]KAH0740797.1 hypothetical protein KY290_033840 [Solanum tuberosum]
MPKVNRFKNPLKLANGHASSSTTPAAQALPDASTIPLQAHEVSHQKQAPILLQEEQASIPQQQEQAPLPLQQEQVPILPSNSSVPFMNHFVYSKYWNVYTMNSENAIKQIWVNAKEVNNLTVGERIIVNFDDNITAYGQAQGLLVGYCGSLATDCNLFSICFERWSGPLGMPNKYIEDCFETRLKVSESDAYRYCNASISKGWATHRQRLWNEYFDPAKSKNDILSNVPSGISKDQWASFVAYRLKPSTMDGGVAEEFDTLVSPQQEPADVENDPISPVDIRRSSANNNANHQSAA